MSDLQRIEISHFPGIPQILRKVAVLGRNEDYEQQTVTLVCRVEHYDQSGNRYRPLQKIEGAPVLLIATDTSMVNPVTGALVFPDPETGGYPAGSVGQYTWLKMAVEQNGVNPFVIAAGAVVEADSFQRFDQ